MRLRILCLQSAGASKSPFGGPLWWRPFPLEIRGALRIHRQRETEFRQQAAVAEGGDLADLARLAEVEQQDPLGVQRPLIVGPVAAERRPAVRPDRHQL